MKDMSPIESTIELVPLDQIDIAPDNPRYSDPRPEGIEELADSISEMGLMNPLVGYAEGDKTLIVAGGRRTRALRLLAERGEIAADDPIPVRHVTKVSALAVGIADNLSSEAMTDHDICRIFLDDSIRQSRSQIIARTFGKSVKWVEQRRRVVDLPEKVVDLYLGGQLNTDQMFGLTYWIGRPDEEIIETAIQATEVGWMNGARIRDAAMKERKNWGDLTERFLVTEEDYREAGGQLEPDLFNDSPIVCDLPLLRELALDKAIKRAEAEAEARGFKGARFSADWNDRWDRVQVQRVLTPQEQDEYTALSEQMEAYEEGDEDKELNEDQLERLQDLHEIAEGYEFEMPEAAKPLTYLEFSVSWHARSEDGIISYREGVYSKENEPELIEAGFLSAPEQAAKDEVTEDGKAPADETPAYSAKVIETLNRIKVHAARQELAKKPDMAVALLFQSLASVYAGPIAAAMQYFDRDLAIDTEVVENDKLTALVDATADYRELSAEEVVALKPSEVKKALAALAIGFLRTDAIPLEVNVRDWWTPDEAFFSALTKPQLIAALMEMRDGVSQEDYATAKKGALVSACVEAAKSNTAWLPSH